MILLELKGGLGNQMFQYAAARAILKEKEKVIVSTASFYMNTMETETNTPRNYSLGCFSNLQLRKLKPFEIYLLNSKFYIIKLIRRLLWGNIKHCYQKDAEWVNIKRQMKTMYLNGYFQSEKYFKEYKNQLLFEFNFPNVSDCEICKQVINKILKTNDSVSIHVRRGDYLKSQIGKIHNILPLSYYLKSIEIMIHELNNPHFFVFSDDIDWCKKNFSCEKYDKMTFVDCTNDDMPWVDMAMMKICKHHIVANSSYSWWGAWLSEKKGLKIAPFNWFNKEYINYNINDIVPSNWIIVEYD